MADDKKDKKGPPPMASGDRVFGELAVIAIVLFLLVALFRRVGAFVSAFFENRGAATGSDAVNAGLSNLYYFFGDFALFYTILANIVSVFFLMALIYCLIRLTELNKAEHESVNSATSVVTGADKQQDEQWNKITEHINTDNPNDWRLAILEADIILDTLLTKIGCVGATVGEKLQQVEKSDFTTIDSAWEAHKVRNSIAHEGQQFLITKREAQRVIRLYEAVFKEFHYI